MIGKGYLLGIDAGSSLCKAALFDETGALCGLARQRTPLSRPQPSWCEMDPEQSWNAVLKVIRDVVADAGIDATEIRGIGLSAAMIGAWFLDEVGNVLRPGINWEDSRSQSVLDRMEGDNPDFMSEIFLSSGSVLQQGCTLPVVAWFNENQPDFLKKVAHVISYKDFIRFRLTGEIATDRSEASVIPGDARTRSRSDAMIAKFGLIDHAHRFPPVRNSESIAGGLSRLVAKQTGLPEGLPVAIGAGDVPCTVTGVGGLAPGQVTAVLGTTCMVGMCHREPVFEPKDLGLLFSIPGDCWYRAMVNVAGTLNLDWALDALAPDIKERPDVFDQVTRMVEAIPIGAEGVVYLPYLSQSGIIAPVVDPNARAQFAGLSPIHTRAHMLRAVFEGVAFALADLIDLLGFEGAEIRLTGGGSQSRFWSQMIADVIGKRVLVPSGSEFGAKGAALILATALGDFSSVREAAFPTEDLDRQHDPDLARASAYADARATFANVRQKLLRG
ncbi:xylulokinase [Cohaesibacter sp. ES.047]|uniref:FGGY-family carbohydrate kinase n=1 Tax=Cohaesibacter sp. ES.047 TaxID=1798205 RepID=UPI000BB776EC|nr:FGGY-family carbohydrate kinase [Cohaesibacter sp. ES.047]SNY90207.1 xylulokinase [Cohaesibacter sp. ES.047]